MKKILYTLLFSILLASCIDYDDATREVSASVQLVMPTELTNGSQLQGHTVTLSQNGKLLTAETDVQGIARFDGIIPDVYDISCSWEMTADEYKMATGRSLTGGTSCTVSGTLNSCLIKSEKTISLNTILGVNHDIIISKVYFTGSTYEGTNRAYTAGQYLELYNQSDMKIDISGLYIALTETDNPQAYTLNNLHEAYADTMLVVKQIFQIPPTQPYILQPGGTLLITNSAVDHTGISPFEHNLVEADFEAKDSRGRTQNNPATPELPLIFCSYNNMTYVNFMTNGLMGIVIFRTDDDISTWAPVYGYGKERGNMFKLLPKRYVIDGMESLSNKAQTGPDVTMKRLYSDIDAGYTFVNAASGRSGEVIYRKTARITADGRKVLADTNNSGNDFQVSTTIKPREYDD